MNERAVGTEESVEILVDTEPRNTTESASAYTSRRVAANQHDSQYGISAWTQDRLNGDRHQSKYQATGADADEESEPDISKYHVSNGILVEVEELDLTGEV
jgi:hypothetical protein